MAHERMVMRAALRNLLIVTVVALTVCCVDGYGAYQLVWSDEFEYIQLEL